MQQHCTAVAGRSLVRPLTTSSTLWAYCPSVSQCCHHVASFLLHIKLVIFSNDGCTLMYKVDIHHPNWDLDAFALNRQGKKSSRLSQKWKRGGSEEGRRGQHGATTVKIWDSSLHSGCMTGTAQQRWHIVAVRNILECKWQRGEMTTGRLRDRGQRPMSVSAQEERSQPPLHRCSAFLFIPQPFIKCFLASFLLNNTANLLSSHLTSLHQSSGHLMERLGKLVCTCPKLV